MRTRTEEILMLLNGFLGKFSFFRNLVLQLILIMESITGLEDKIKQFEESLEKIGKQLKELTEQQKVIKELIDEITSSPKSEEFKQRNAHSILDRFKSDYLGE